MSGDPRQVSNLLSEDQYLLQDTSRRLAQNFFPHDVRQDNPEELQRRKSSAWSELVATGLVGLLISDVAGGSGGTLTDACVVAEAMGVEMAPVPFVSSSIAAAAVLVHCSGGADDLRQLAQGAQFSLLVDRTLSWPGTGQLVAWEWAKDARVVGLDADGIAHVSAADAEQVDEWFDALRPLATVAENAPSRVGIDDGARRALAIARVGCAAQLLGIASGALDDAVAYAKQREQYGQPIGSFQAVQHLCAEMLVDVETSRSVVYGTSAMVEVIAIDEAERIAAVAKAWTSEAAIRVCETSIQVLGGIGITREHVAHLRLRDAHLFARALGRPNEIYQELAVRRLAVSNAHG